MLNTLIGARRSWILVILSIFSSILILESAGSESSTATGATDGLPQGKQSTIVVEKQELLPGDAVNPAILFFTKKDESTFNESEIANLNSLTVAIKDQAFGGALAPAQISQDGKAALIVLPLATTSDTDAIAEKIDVVREEINKALAPSLEFKVTGGAGFQADISKVFDGANVRLLAATAGVVALLLLITYRSPVLWLVPLIVVGLADRLAVTAALKASEVLGIPVDDAGSGILSVLVFGAGTNYALLLVSRYRDELRIVDSRVEAMRRAVSEVRESIVSAASTVILGISVLLLSLSPTTRGLGMSGAIGIAIALFFALVVLPSALMIFGRKLFWPFVPKVGQTLSGEKAGIWGRIGNLISKRPTRVLVSGSVALVIAALGLLSVTTGLSQNETFLKKPESVAAQEELGKYFPVGVTSPVEVITSNASVSTVVEKIKSADSSSIVEIGKTNGSITQVDVLLKNLPGSEASYAEVTNIREILADVPNTYVGGTIAKEIDASDAAKRDIFVIAPLILLLVFSVLILLLRSIVGPVVLLLTVVATYAASMGISWQIFDRFFNFPALDSGVPLLSFLFLVALGVDYNIFLVARAKQEIKSHENSIGFIRALSSTGGVITSAGILLASVFAVLGVLPIIVLTQIGVIVFVGVLLDTLLVRTVIVPALGIRLGEKFWWPGKSPV
jgi:RND superfamily putative drug exporter